MKKQNQKKLKTKNKNNIKESEAKINSNYTKDSKNYQIPNNNQHLIKFINNNYIYYYYHRRLYGEKVSKEPPFIKIFEKIIEFFFDKFSKWLNFVGPLFVNSFACFYFLIYHSFTNNIIPYWSNYFNYKNPNKIYYYIFYLIICPLYFIIYIQLVLNFFLVVIIKPGSISDLQKSKKFKKKLNPYYSYKYLPNLHYILRKGNFNNHLNYSFPYCKFCKEIKPLRTHHCSVCKKCHLRMDHHCPWVNNCIGLNNFRYFALFLFHLWCISILNTLLSFYPFFTMKSFDDNNEFSFATVLCMCGVGISTFFNIWYWSMILYNCTSIEYWGRRMNSENKLIKSYSMKTFKENLFITFGCSNIFRILFVPNFRSLNISGLEWTKIANPDFEIKGIKNNLDLIY